MCEVVLRLAVALHTITTREAMLALLCNNAIPHNMLGVLSREYVQPVYDSKSS
jgi:hypothetical protein